MSRTPTQRASLVTRLNFGQFTEGTLCGAIENVRGALVVEFLSEGVGPARAQTVMLSIMRELRLQLDLHARTRTGFLARWVNYGTVVYGINDRLFFATIARPLCKRKLAVIGRAYGWNPA